MRIPLKRLLARGRAAATVRVATAADLPHLTRMVLEQCAEDLLPMTADAPAGVEGLVGLLLDNPAAVVLVAEAGAAPVGMLAVVVAPASPWNSRLCANVGLIYVEPPHRGRHVEATLMRAALAVAEDAGVTCWRTDTQARHEAHRRLFETTLGMTPETTTITYFADLER